MADPRSLVLEHPPRSAADVKAYFTAKLTFETDASDLYHDLKTGITDLLVVDPRAAEAYAQGHIPGAVNLPHRIIDRSTVENLPQGRVLILCPAGTGCNAAQKAAVRLVALGQLVKELAGGLDWWQRNGFPVATGQEPGSLS